MLWGFTTDNPMIIYLIVGALALPNALAQVIVMLAKKNPAPLWSFHFSIMMNLGYSLVIYGFIDDSRPKSIWIPGIVTVSLVLLFTLIPCDRCCKRKCCKKSFQGNHFVWSELYGGVLDASDFREVVMRNRSAQPAAFGHVEAWHDETYTVTVRSRDADGNIDLRQETRTRHVTTWSDTRQFQYQTWQEEGNSIRLDNDISVIHALFYVRYKFEPEDAFESFLAGLRSEGYGHDCNVTIKHWFECPDVQEVVCGTTRQNKTCFMRFFGSCFGKFFWLLAFITGYQSFYECIFAATGERMRMKLVKRMSRGTGLRAKVGEPDHVGAETAFKVGGPVEMVGPGIDKYGGTGARLPPIPPPGYAGQPGGYVPPPAGYAPTSPVYTPTSDGYAPPSPVYPPPSDGYHPTSTGSAPTSTAYGPPLI